jgi:hypothetical protein
MAEQQLPKLDLNRYDVKDFKRLKNGDILQRDNLISWDLDKQTLVLICFNSKNEKKWEHSMVGSNTLKVLKNPSNSIVSSLIASDLGNQSWLQNYLDWNL